MRNSFEVPLLLTNLRTLSLTQFCQWIKSYHWRTSLKSTPWTAKKAAIASSKSRDDWDFGRLKKKRAIQPRPAWVVCSRVTAVSSSDGGRSGNPSIDAPRIVGSQRTNPFKRLPTNVFDGVVQATLQNIARQCCLSDVRTALTILRFQLGRRDPFHSVTQPIHFCCTIIVFVRNCVNSILMYFPCTSLTKFKGYLILPFLLLTCCSLSSGFSFAACFSSICFLMFFCCVVKCSLFKKTLTLLPVNLAMNLL